MEGSVGIEGGIEGTIEGDGGDENGDEGGVSRASLEVAVAAAASRQQL